jgi:hypothetical protein
LKDHLTEGFPLGGGLRKLSASHEHVRNSHRRRRTLRRNVR